MTTFPGVVEVFVLWGWTRFGDVDPKTQNESISMHRFAASCSRMSIKVIVSYLLSAFCGLFDFGMRGAE